MRLNTANSFFSSLAVTYAARLFGNVIECPPTFRCTAETTRPARLDAFRVGGFVPFRLLDFLLGRCGDGSSTFDGSATEWISRDQAWLSPRL